MKEAYVSLEVAKLLKEKGFSEETNWYYNSKGSCEPFSAWVSAMPYDYSPMPTHQMACAWLREKHNILISIIPQEVKVGVDKLCYAIYRITEDGYTPLYNGYINSLINPYEKTVEAALKYSLKNLI